MAAWPYGWLSLIGAGSCERAGGARGRRGPGALRGRGGGRGGRFVGGEGGADNGWRRGKAAGTCTGYAVMGAPSPAVRLAGLLGAFIPSGGPRPGWLGGLG